MLKQLAPHLAVIHAQNEAVLAFDAARDWRCWTASPESTFSRLPTAFAAWNGVRHRIADLERDEQDRLRLLDLWSFQRKEIAGADLQPEEDAKLEAEKRVLANAEKVYGAAMAAYDALYESKASAAALIRRPRSAIWRSCRASMSSFATVDGRSWIRRASRWRTSARRCATTPRASRPRPSAWPKWKTGWPLLDRLKRKYGPTLEDVIALGDELERKLNEMENKDEVLRKLRLELADRGGEISGAARGVVAAALRSCPQAGEAGREPRSTSWR